MAIIDQNLVFLDGPLRGSGVSGVVPVNALTLAGRMEPIPLRVSVTQGFDPAETAELTLTLQQAARPDAPNKSEGEGEGEGAWEDVPGASLTTPGAALNAGARLPWRFVPEGVTLGWLRLRHTLTPQAGMTPTTGAVFAALMREEDFPYVAAQKVK